MLAAYGYTGGKHPRVPRPGDVFVFIFFGPVAVCGTTLVTGGGLWPVAVLASIAIGILTVNILVANNLRDRALDERAGKRTLSVRLGEEKTRRLFAVSNMVAFVIVAWLAILAPVALLGMTGAIPAVRRLGRSRTRLRQGLIPVLQMTSLALLLTGLGLGWDSPSRADVSSSGLVGDVDLLQVILGGRSGVDALIDPADGLAHTGTHLGRGRSSHTRLSAPLTRKDSRISSSPGHQSSRAGRRRPAAE